MWVVGYGLRVVCYELWVVGYGLRVAGCRMRDAGCGRSLVSVEGEK